MSAKKLSEPEKAFLDEVRTLEDRLFHDQLDETDPRRMKSDQYSWRYRPSHHISTGLMTKEDIEQSNKRILSVGASPAFFERVLCELGIPSENIVVADKDPEILQCEGPMEKRMFDVTQPWPDMGTFDLILFPESLCMCVTGYGKAADTDTNTDFPGDEQEAKALSFVLTEALKRLRPGGEIRANGPMSHPNVVKAANARLQREGYKHSIDYQRFFLTVRHFQDAKF